jgi:hypothetical protein
LLSKIGEAAVRSVEWVPLGAWAIAAYVKGGTIGFFEGDRPDWQKRLAAVAASFTIATTLGFAWLGLATITTDLRKVPALVADYETAGPIADVRSLAVRALANDAVAGLRTDSILSLLKSDICERHEIPSSVCDFWLANGRPDDLRRRE